MKQSKTGAEQTQLLDEVITCKCQVSEEGSVLKIKPLGSCYVTVCTERMFSVECGC